MIIKRKDYGGVSFTPIDNNAIRDESVSLGARGLLHYMLSCKEDWKFSVEGLCNGTNTKLAKLNTYLKELVGAGYLKKETKRDDKGKFLGFEWIVSEEPILRDNELF